MAEVLRHPEGRQPFSRAVEIGSLSGVIAPGTLLGSQVRYLSTY
jgi:hypothetical protein